MIVAIVKWLGVGGIVPIMFFWEGWCICSGGGEGGIVLSGD